MDTETMEKLLTHLKTVFMKETSKSKDYYLNTMHVLAEAQYEPALAFFSECLNDVRSDWRYDCLQAMGFHYDLSDKSETLDRIRKLLLTDEDDLIRTAAARILSVNGKWPESTLIQSMTRDSDVDVRIASFLALVKLAGLNFNQRRLISNKLDDGSISPSLEALDNIIQEYSLNVSIDK